MVQIELAEKDAGILLELLQSCLSDLKTERIHTDNKEFHHSLLEREKLISDLIARLGSNLTRL